MQFLIISAGSEHAQLVLGHVQCSEVAIEMVHLLILFVNPKLHARGARRTLHMYMHESAPVMDILTYIRT